MECLTPDQTQSSLESFVLVSRRSQCCRTTKTTEIQLSTTGRLTSQLIEHQSKYFVRRKMFKPWETPNSYSQNQDSLIHMSTNQANLRLVTKKLLNAFKFIATSRLAIVQRFYFFLFHRGSMIDDEFRVICFHHSGQLYPV